MKPDIVHFWYNGDSTLTALQDHPQADQIQVAPAYFLFGVDPGIYADRKPQVLGSGRHELRAGMLGRPQAARGRRIFRQVLRFRRRSKGPQSSVSLLYYDYFFMYAKALEQVGKVDDPDAVVDAILKMNYQGVVSPVPLVFNSNHQVTFATEVCAVKPNTSDDFTCATEQPPASPPPGDAGG